MPWPSMLFIPLIIAATATVTAAPVASAQQPPDDQRSVTAGPRGSEPIELTWLSAGVVPARGGAGPATSSAAVVGRQPSPNLGAAAAPGRDATPIPFDDLISNYGCMMVEAEPGKHLGVNCIDQGWLNTDGTVYVHTTVPAWKQVRFSSSPPAGTAVDGTPEFASFDLDTSPDYSGYEFTSKPFVILPAHTYYILAMAWDSEGNMAWRYGTATVPHTADVVIDRITVLNDGDEYSVNKGEIEFRIIINDQLVEAIPEEKYDDGDSFDPDADLVIHDSPPLVKIVVSATEDDPGECVIESNLVLLDQYEDGGGCHFAQAGEVFDLTTAEPGFGFDFTSPDEHLRIRVEGQISLTIP